jgi:hypothetical protein
MYGAVRIGQLLQLAWPYVVGQKDGYTHTPTINGLMHPILYVTNTTLRFDDNNTIVYQKKNL